MNKHDKILGVLCHYRNYKGRSEFRKNIIRPEMQPDMYSLLNLGVIINYLTSTAVACSKNT